MILRMMAKERRSHLNISKNHLLAQLPPNMKMAIDAFR